VPNGSSTSVFRDPEWNDSDGKSFDLSDVAPTNAVARTRAASGTGSGSRSGSPTSASKPRDMSPHPPAVLHSGTYHSLRYNIQLDGLNCIVVFYRSVRVPTPPAGPHRRRVQSLDMDHDSTSDFDSFAASRPLQSSKSGMGLF